MTTDIDPLDPEHIPEGMVQLADGRLVGRKTVTAGDEVLVDPQTEERADTDASLEADPADPEAVAERMDALTGTAIPENEGVDTGTDTPAYTGPQTRSERTPTVREQQAESKHQPQQRAQRDHEATVDEDEPEHIQPAPHEADVFLWFNQHGVSPYWAFADALINHVDEDTHTLTADLDDGTWQIEFTCSRSGIAPRPQDNVDTDVVYEYELHVSGPDRKSIYYNISPRWDDMRGPDGRSLSIPWIGGEGVDVHAEGSHIPIEEYPHYLWLASRAVFDDLGLRFNPGYFDEPLPESNIVTYERYVRLRRQWGESLAQGDGVFIRLLMTLTSGSDLEVDFRMNRKRDQPKRYAADLSSNTLSELSAFDSQLGKRIKLYHPKYLRKEADPDDPLSHPKLGVAFHKSTHGEALSWDEREMLERDLEEWVINILRWGEVPHEADPSTFVEDDVFKVRTSTRQIAMPSNPLPKIEAKQEHLVASIVADLDPTAGEVLQELATDGGQHYEELAEAVGRSTSTIYRALDRLGDLTRSDGDGIHRLASYHIRKKVLSIVDQLEELGQSVASRIESLLNVNLQETAGSALEQWAEEYDVELRGDEISEVTLKIDDELTTLKSTSKPRLEEVLKEGLDAWTSVGRDAKQFFRLTFETKLHYHGKVRRRVNSVISGR